VKHESTAGQCPGWFDPPDRGEATLRLPVIDDPGRVRIVALVPAHNEEAGIAATIRSLLDQTRPLDEIVIISDNSTDRTVEIARRFPVTVLETEGNTHRKSGALNMAWNLRCKDADIIVGADGDTRLPPHAVADWEAEFARNPQLGGSSSQPIMTGHGFLPRLQRNEFSKGCQMSLARGWCRVVSGTGCAYRNVALHEVAKRPHRAGPWTYESVVEDYHLTYNMRQAGWLCEMSETVWCWTGSMTSMKALWYQRIKWQAGTCGDLLTFGFNRLNYREWAQQAFLVLCIGFWLVWWSMQGPRIVAGDWHFSPLWDLAMPAFFASMELIHVRRQREKDWKDWLLAGSLIYMTTYSILAVVWGLASWVKVIRARMGDLWAPQYRAGGMAAEEMQVGVSAT
jgi:poly-beta-1,6-N-acetyl-D-glucosamine synthase